MKRPITKENPNSRGQKFDGLGSIDKKKMTIKKKKKNMMRMGGGGLSLEAFANAKTKTNEYNPALISIFIFLSLLSSHVYTYTFTLSAQAHLFFNCLLSSKFFSNYTRWGFINGFKMVNLKSPSIEIHSSIKFLL